MAEQVRIDADPGGGTTRRYSGSCIGDQERQDQPVQPKHAGPACTARRVAPRDQITEGSVTVARSHARLQPEGGALGGTRTPTMLLTATSRQRVYQFRHER